MRGKVCIKCTKVLMVYVVVLFSLNSVHIVSSFNVLCSKFKYFGAMDVLLNFAVFIVC